MNLNSNLPSFGASFRSFANLATITVLFMTRGPTAIARFVISHIIDAIDAVKLTRPAPHIGDEVFVRLPAFADRDSTTPVIGVCDVVLVSAARQHIGPSSILRGLFTVHPLTMLFAGPAPRNPHLSTKAPAGFCLSTSKFITHLCRFVSTVTKTNPTELPVLSFLSHSQNNPTSVAQPFKIYFHHSP